jgi:sugar phosphate isomerase/epimerase
MLFDTGHAHIAAALRRTDAGRLLEPVADTVGLFHVHDNFGTRRHDLQAPGVDPLRLDLHLVPGSGSLPWERVAPSLLAHEAPLMLEIGPGVRQEPVALHTALREALGLGVAPAAAA